MRWSHQAGSLSRMTKNTRSQICFLLLLLLVAVGVAPARGLAVAPAPADAPQHERAPMDDGAELDGWIWLPAGAATGQVPTILMFSPYFGNLDSPGNAPNERLVEVGDVWLPRTVLPVERMVAEGYAVALFNVRGTGDSSGCYDFYGSRTAKDGAQLSEWLARQGWSDGRVGMIGVSEDGGTALSAATEAPKSLKAVVSVAPPVDRFILAGTPNGLLSVTYGVGDYPAALAATGVLPPLYRSAAGMPYAEPEWALRWALAAEERLCDDTRQSLEASIADPFVEVRHKSWWDDRRISDRLPEVRAAVLATMGFNDSVVYGFGVDAIGWNAMPKAPKSMILGPWGHNVPPDGTPIYGDWFDEVSRWFGYWLKRSGPKPDGLGLVRYQTDDGAWHRSAAWGTGEAQEVFDLTAAHGRSFTASSQAVAGGPPHPCAEDGSTSLVHLSDPVAADTIVAGVPFGLLRVSASERGGQVGVQLLELDDDFSCVTNPTAYTPMSWGIVDLLFDDGGFTAESFVGPADVRIDLETVGQRIEAGHRIAAVISAGDASIRNGYRYTPQVTVHPGSHLVLPVKQGTLGGAAPTVAYPPRPNGPDLRSR